MDADRYRVVKQAFHEVSALPSPARQAWLRALGERDPGLAEEIGHLLAAHEHAGGFLDRPAAADLGQALLARDMARLAEIFQKELTFVAPLGEGGMGRVFLARQNGPVSRSVALKTVKPGPLPDAVLSSFELERQTLADISHPHISRIYQAGLIEGDRPYFLMEYIEGVPITEFCDRERLGIGARLRLFHQVCGAIRYAHQKGIIHRDLKPANILVTLVDGVPAPKIIDFGIVKMASAWDAEDRPAGEPDRVGTPAYMSPERFDSGETDTGQRLDGCRRPFETGERHRPQCSSKIGRIAHTGPPAALCQPGGGQRRRCNRQCCRKAELP